MRLALLGWHADARPLLQAVSDSAEDSLPLAVAVPSQYAAEVRRLVPGARLEQDWQTLVAAADIDAVIVAGTDAAAIEGARQLATDGKPIVLIPTALQGSAFIYELTLIRDDNSVRLIAVPGLKFHPLGVRLREWIQDGTLGDLQLIRIDRATPGESSTALFHQAQTDTLLLDDVCLLRSLGGSYNRVTAVNAGSADSTTQATVTLGGDSLAEATWSARPGTTEWSLEVRGSRAHAKLTMNPVRASGHGDGDSFNGTLTLTPCETSGANAAVESSSDSLPLNPESITENGAGLGARQLAEVRRLLINATSADVALAWAEMTRAFESVEATHTSLRRRRTIDLFFETTSERSIFKSQMTAVGCGLILMTLFGLVVLLMLGAFLDSRTMVQRSASAEGRVIEESEFTAGLPTLNAAGQRHLAELVLNTRRSPRPIFVMPATDGDQPELDAARIRTVIETLRESGTPDPTYLVEPASVPHPAMTGLMTVLKYLWIAPLVLFLLLQSLLTLTRPGAKD